MSIIDIAGGRKDAVDNIGDPADFVVTRIHWAFRWQSDSYLDSNRSDHSDIQPGLWPARLGA
jgi:hypothetical protein